MATQTLVDEEYAGKDVGSAVEFDKGKVTVTNITELAEIDGTIDGVEINKDGKVTKLVYTKDGKTCTYSVAGNKGIYEVK